MTFKLPDLPYSRDALAPQISPETLEYHYGKHHKKYVDTLNELTQGTPWGQKTLEEIIRTADGKIFNNSAQTWNHTFYWNGLRPGGASRPGGALARAVDDTFGGLEQLKDRFTKVALDQFGSGWAWLVQERDGKLAVVSTGNADNPLRSGSTPLLTCDVWEHAYYIDYRNDRAKYLAAFWPLINWDFVAHNMK